MEAREQGMLYQLVRKGVGIAILDPFIIGPNTDGTVAVPFEPVTEWEYYLVSAKDVRHPQVAKAFNAKVSEYFMASEV